MSETVDQDGPESAEQPTGSTPSAEGDGLVLTVSEAAMEKVLEIRNGEDDAEDTGLRVMIVGTRGVEFDYDLSLESISGAPEDSLVYEVGPLTVIIPADLSLIHI